MGMNRRNALIGMGALAAGGGGLIATGAFSTVEAERTVSVSTAGDGSALLQLEPSGAGTSSPAVFLDNGIFTIDFSQFNANVNLGAVTTIGSLSGDPYTGVDTEAFTIANGGSDQVEVSFDISFHSNQSGENIASNSPSDHLKLWTDASGNSNETGAINGGSFGNLVASNLSLPAGESVTVAVQVDTTSLNTSDVSTADPLFADPATVTASTN